MPARKRKEPVATAPKGDLGDEFFYTIPCTQGIQAGRAYWCGMIPINLLKKFFRFDEITHRAANPIERAQRLVQNSRVKKIKKYILENPDTYVFPAVTVMIDSDVEFKEISSSAPEIGLLKVPMDARFDLADGQHRIASLKAALIDNPELGDETISAAFFINTGLQRKAQVFLDINQSAAKVSKSNIILYDHRDKAADICRSLLKTDEFIRSHTDLEKNALTSKNSFLFTLNGWHSAVVALLRSPALAEKSDLEKVQTIQSYWSEVKRNIKPWWLADQMLTDAVSVRDDGISTTAIALEAMGMVGSTLLCEEDWRSRLEGWENVDWSRSNPVWSQIGVLNGYRIVKNKVTTINLKDVLVSQLKESAND